MTLTKGLISAVLNWRVNTNYNGSDHNTIEFQVAQDIAVIPKVWVWHKANWPLFQDKLKSITYDIPNNITQDVCEDMLSKLYYTINKAMIKSIPRSKTKTIDKNNPWWTEEFKNERRSVNKAYKSMIRSPTQHNVNRYKNKHAEYKKKCNKARLWSWRGLQQDIGNISEMNMFRKIIQSTTKVSLGTLKTSNGDYTEPGENTIDFLSKVHFSKSTPLRATTKRGKIIKRNQVLEWDETYLTTNKIKEAIDGFKSKKSPGTDGIHPLVLQHLPPEAISYLETLYRICILLEYTPTKWKECKVVFIHTTQPNPGGPYP